MGAESSEGSHLAWEGKTSQQTSRAKLDDTLTIVDEGITFVMVQAAYDDAVTAPIYI